MLEDGAPGVGTCHGAVLPALVGSPVEQRLPHIEASSVHSEPAARAAAAGLLLRQRLLLATGASSGQLVGHDGLRAVGQVVQRLPCVARRIAARTLYQPEHVRTATAHLQQQHLLHLVLLPAICAEHLEPCAGMISQ
jgi:hypothetical protein